MLERALEDVRRRPLEGVLAIAATGILVSTLIAALHDVSQNWDAGYYHLPFAGRIAGILPPSLYVFSAENEPRFQGFPLLGEALQGILWRALGTPAAANLVAWSSVPLWAWFLARRRIAWFRSVVFAFAIPLVLAHATSAYVDLPANVGAAILVVSAIDAWSGERSRASHVSLAIASAAAIVAGNMKFQLAPIVGLSLLALGVGRRAPVWFVGTTALAFATMLKNAWRYRNPVWPIELHLPAFLASRGLNLPYAERAYAQAPAGFEDAPKALLWVRSIFEIGARPLGDPMRWSLDQWTPTGEPGFRMGGFFGVAVAVHLGLLAALAIANVRGARRTAGLFLLVSLVYALVPQAHELRYYLSWMLVLVATNAGLLAATKPVFFDVLALGTFAVVVGILGPSWAISSGSTFEELLARHVAAETLARIPEGGRACVDASRFTYLYAAPFHPPRRYVVREAGDEARCSGDPIVTP